MGFTEDDLFGYRIYFRSEENNESVHVHVCKGGPTVNAVKIGAPPDDNPVVAHNNGHIPPKDLNRLLKGIASNKESIVFSWYQHFGI